MPAPAAWPRSLALIVLAASPAVAGAHGTATVPGLGTGLVAPWAEAGQVLPALAAALLAGQARQAAPAGGRHALAFAAAAALGLWLVARGVVMFDFVPWPSVVGAALGGAIVVWGRPWPPVVITGASAMLGAAFGLAALPPVALLAPGAPGMSGLAGWMLGLATGPGSWWLGVWASGSAGMAVLAAATGRLRARGARIGMRVVGSWIVASATIVLAMAAAPPLR